MVESSKYTVARSTQKETGPDVRPTATQIITAFVAGTLTLGVEIVVGRVLAPFFGSSLHQWAALIGVVLLAYMIGYASYVRIVSRGLFPTLAIAGLYTVSLPIWIHDGVSSMLGLPLAVASVLGASVAVGAPSVLWACVLPELQRQVGTRYSARILAWSSAGNLLGAWGVAFLLVPYLGTRMSLILLGLASILAGALWWRRSSRVVSLVLAVGCAGGLGWTVHAGSDRAVEPWKLVQARELGEWDDLKRAVVSSRDSAYQNIAVWDETSASGVRRALTLNGSLQFLWKLDGTEKLIDAGNRYDYYNYSTAAVNWTAPAPAKEILILGLGGGLIPWQILQFFPDAQLTSFELDPGVYRAARELLPLSLTSGVTVQIGDGRQLLKNDSTRYDYILLDTFLNSYVPFHLTTKEFFALARDRLSPGGVLVANFHTVFRTSGLLPKLEATIRSVFPSVGAFELPAGTTLIVASQDSSTVLVERLRDAATRGDPALAELSLQAAGGLRAAEEPLPHMILTDDLNDTEQRLYETRKYILVSRPF